MNPNWKTIILYSLIIFLFPIYSFIKTSDLLPSLIGVKWYLYKEYSNPCCGGRGWDRVSESDSKHHFELEKNGKVTGDYFSYTKYHINDSVTFELIDTNKNIQPPYYLRIRSYKCSVDNDTVTIFLNIGCKEGCGWKFIKQN